MNNLQCRVLLADAHPVARKGLRFFLDSVSSITVVGEATSAREVVALAEQLAPDVLLIDPMHAEPGGIACIRQICQRCPTLRLLVLTSVTGSLLAQQAVNAGAAGYLSKEVSGHELVAAIRTVCAGDRVLDRRARAALEQRSLGERR